MPIPTRLAVLLALSPSLAALPDVGDTERVSVTSAGAEASFTSEEAAISGDGRFVAFESGADDLVPGDTNFSTDVFVHDRETGETTRVSVSSSGAQGNFHSDVPAISDDGRYVVFRSRASNLVAGDTNGLDDVFLHDRETGTTTRVSVDQAGGQLSGHSNDPAISRDGRYVAFVSVGKAVPGIGPTVYHAFLRDLTTGTNTLLSLSTAGLHGDQGCRGPSISDDGTAVALSSVATNLVPGDTNGTTDVFVRDLAAGTTTRVSVSTAGAQGNSYSHFPSISGDGRRVAFESQASTLVSGDVNVEEDVFLHDRDTGETTIQSVDSSGVYGNSGSHRPSLSADGTRIAFYSWSSNLAAGDWSGQDIFVRDVAEGTTALVSLSSEGVPANNHSHYPAISSDGRVVAFSSVADNLVPGDTNGWYDVFAHVYEAPPPVGPSARLVAFASSEGFVAVAQVQPGGVARSTSTGPASSFTAQAKAGLSPSGATLTSASYVAHVATASMVDGLTPGGTPLVFGTAPYAGDKDGGPVAIHGFDLDDGSGTAAASLAGVPAAGVATTSNTVLATTSGAGVNQHGNPLGRGDVAVTTAAGDGALTDGFVYGPALTEDAPPQVGETYPLHLHLEAGDLYQLAFGTSISGLSAPVYPLDGAAEILLGIVQLTPLLPATSDLVVLALPIPDNPALAGLTIELQAAVITSLAPLGGTFTNRLETVFAP